VKGNLATISYKQRQRINLVMGEGHSP